MNIRFASVIVGMVFVSGCASVGQDFDMAEVDRLQPSVSTFEQVKEKLGKPQSMTNIANGQFSAVWIRSQATIGSVSTKSVSILFGGNGKMVRVVSRSENKTN